MKITKQIAVLTVVSFMLTQVLPAGWAVANLNDLVTGAVEEKVLTKSAIDTENETEAAAKVSAHTGVSTISGAAVDSTTFQMGNGSTLSVASSSPSEDSESEVATSTEQAEPAPLPVAPPLGLTNTDKPATLFYTESDWAETMRDWGRSFWDSTAGTPFTAFGSDFREKYVEPFYELLKDAMTTLRKFAGDVWTEFKKSVKTIYVSNLTNWDDSTAMAVPDSGVIRFNPKKIGELLYDRFRLVNTLIHEAFHIIGKKLDASLGFTLAQGLGGNGNELSTDARSFKTTERIANNAVNERGWREVIGDERTNGDTGTHYFLSSTVKNEAYTVTVHSSSREQTVTRFTIGNFDWAKFGTLSGRDYLFRKNGEFMQNMMTFGGESEVYRADNTLARIIQYEKSGKGILPGENNRIASITHYDASGTLKTSREDYVYAAGNRYQVTVKNAAGEILSAKWYQTVNGKPVELPLGWNLPTNIIATTHTATGVVTLSGKRASDTSIWYSLDGGVTYKQLVAAGSNVAWAAKITLPVGTSTISVISRIAGTAAGVPSVISSDPVVLAPITYIAPTVAAPTVTATVPTAEGVVTLAGTRVANTSIWYSLDGGATYKQLVASSANTSWTGKITLPVGASTVSVISKTTAIVSGVSTTISSEAAIVGPIISVPTPKVTTPAATVRTNPLVLKGTKAAGESLWISADGGLTYTLLVENNTATTWSASQTLLIGANNFMIVAKDASLNSSAVVIVRTVTYDPFTVASSLSDQPPLRFTEAERKTTENEWAAACQASSVCRTNFSGGRITGVTENVKQIILDVLTTLRFYANDYWKEFKTRIFQIQNGAMTQSSDVGAAAKISNDGTNGYFILGPAFFAKKADGSVDQTKIADTRANLLQHLLHEGYHVIRHRVDDKIGVSSQDLLVEVNEQPNERFADWRAMQTIQAIAKKGGWDEVYGNNEFQFTSDNEAYQIVYDQKDPTLYKKVYYRFGDLNFDATRFWTSGLTSSQRRTIKNTYWTYVAGRRVYYLNFRLLFSMARTMTGSEICHV